MATLRRSVLVIVLLLCLVSQLLQLVLILLEFWLFLQPSLIRRIRDLALARYRRALLNRGPVIDSLPPLLQVGELGEIDAREV
jgi:hypothetical protein